MICRKDFFLAGLTLCVSFCSSGQTVTSARNGSWNNPATWDGGIVPTLNNSSSVRVEHDVSVDNGNIISSSILVTGKLSVLAPARLKVRPKAGLESYLNVSGGTLQVFGVLAGGDSVRYFTSGSNTSFMSGGAFNFEGGPKAFIPIAQWNDGSKFLITGFRNSGYVALAFSDGWKQSFYEVVYDCPAQTTFVDLNGHLKNIRGDFTIRNTNSNALRLSTTQKSVVTVNGDLRIEGPSEVWFNTTADSARVHVGRNFIYRSSSTGPTYFTTRGKTFFAIGGMMQVDTPGALRFCSGSADSTGIRKTIFSISGDLSLIRANLISPVPGRGVIVFSGLTEQSITASASMFNGNFDFHFSTGSVVHIGSGAIAGNGKVFAKGHLKLGSVSALGPLHASSGNIRTIGERRYYPGCTIEYNGLTRQSFGAEHPADANVNFNCSNAEGLNLLKPVLVNHFHMTQGSLKTNGHAVQVYGDLSFADSLNVENANEFILEGTHSSSVSVSGTRINRLIVQKNSGSVVTVSSPVHITDALIIRNEGNTVYSNGNIVLASVSEDSTATVHTIPRNSSVEGDVIVQRYMRGEGRLYRYISSAVENESVAGLKDDFPVTGRFTDPTTGRGINSSAPSLYLFDESIADPWVPYPLSGFASDNKLEPGRGYAAFIRNSDKPTVWDIKGRLNQGVLAIPVQHSAFARDEVRGWNLVGNPYPCVIDWSRGEGWTKSPDMSAGFAVRDNAERRFHYFDGEIGDLPDGRIAPGQAFWVRASGPDASLSINELAKVAGPAEFYRSASSADKHFVMVTLSGNDLVDKAFLRRRAHSSRRIDRYDITKKQNDFLTLSFLSEDSIAIAINAIDSFKCREEFQLLMQFTKDVSGKFLKDPAGNYTLDVSSSGLLKCSDIMIRDNFLDIVSDSTYSFTIDDNPRSCDEHRFTLIIGTDENPGPPVVSYPGALCRDSVFIIELRSPSRNVRYSAVLPEEDFMAESSDSTMSIRIPANSLLRGTLNAIAIRQENVCAADVIDTAYVFRRAIPSLPELLSAIRCPDGEGRVFIKKKKHEYEYHWFENDSAKIPAYRTSDSLVIFSGDEFVLAKYVAVVDHSGCSSDRLRVDAKLKSVQPLLLQYDQSALISSENVMWYLNDEALSEDSTSSIRPVYDGVYTARSDQGGCYSEESFLLQRDGDVVITPNPFHDELTINSREAGKQITSLRLFSVDGREVFYSSPFAGYVTLATSNLGQGIYVAEVQTPREKYRIRIMKK